MENNELKTAYLIDIPFGRESEYAVVDFGVSEYAVVEFGRFWLPGLLRRFSHLTWSSSA